MAIDNDLTGSETETASAAAISPAAEESETILASDDAIEPNNEALIEQFDDPSIQMEALDASTPDNEENFSESLEQNTATKQATSDASVVDEIVSDPSNELPLDDTFSDEPSEAVVEEQQKTPVNIDTSVVESIGPVGEMTEPGSELAQAEQTSDFSVISQTDAIKLEEVLQNESLALSEKVEAAAEVQPLSIDIQFDRSSIAIYEQVIATWTISGGTEPYSYVYEWHAGNTYSARVRDTKSSGNSQYIPIEGDTCYVDFSIEGASGMTLATTASLPVTGSPLSILITLDKSEVTIGETVTASWTASGGCEPYSYEYYWRVWDRFGAISETNVISLQGRLSGIVIFLFRCQMLGEGRWT